MSDPDALFTLRTNFWLGLYKLAIAEGSGLRHGVPDSLKVERDEFMYRSYIALGDADKVLSEVQDDAPIALQAVKLQAAYEAHPDMRETVLINLSQWMLDPTSANNPTLQLISAIIQCKEGNLTEAASCVRNGVTMEQIALLAQIYLKLDRPDLAAKQHAIMMQADEDHTLTQLVGAWIHIAEGGAKRYTEASLLFGELIDKHQPSVMLLNGQAVARMHLGEYEV
jgi:coatomer protein complex subunit epsilon